MTRSPDAPRWTPAGALRLAFRLALSGLALWLVSRRVDLREAAGLWPSMRWAWLVPGFAALVASHGLSAERARGLWRAAGLDLPFGYAVRLYWAGMFYSLFLPGGVGGDGYKVWVLKRHTDADWGPLLQAGLLDRGAGVAAIAWACTAMALFLLGPPAPWPAVLAAGLALSVPAWAWGMHWVFPRFRRVTWSLAGLSLAKQGLQATSALCLVAALGFTPNGGYALAFLLSSLALLLPISVGGMGARELALSFVPPTFGVEEEVAVSMSLLFFLLNTAFSLGGAAVRTLPVERRA